MKPEWVIYKNDIRIGQAITWHKALDILIKTECIQSIQFIQYITSGLIVLVDVHTNKNYKIIKER